MWSPTHVQVTVCRVKGLLTKGENGTNDAFVTISVGKEKFQTSVKQTALSELEWQEECELAIPTQGNTAEIVLTVLHQNFIGVDDFFVGVNEFLGMVSLPLSNFDVYERPRTKWYSLQSKPGQEGKNKNRGEIEVRVAFTVKSGSLLDLSKKEKHKGRSFGHLSQASHNIGGSLRSLVKEKKGGIKKLASSVVSEDPVVEEEKAGAAMSNAAMATADAAVFHASSPPSLLADGVPSIIIQDSFVVEQPSLSPSASPPSSKLNSRTVPVPKTRNVKNQEVPVEVDLRARILLLRQRHAKARQRKDLATVDEIPTMKVNSQPAGEEANAEFDTGQSLSARPRMSASPPHPSSFPVGVVMNDEHVARPPPVPKPRSLFPFQLPRTTSLEMLNEPSLPSSDEFPIIQQQPVVPPRNFIDVKYSPSQISPIQLNPFVFVSVDGQYSDSDVYDQRFEDDDRRDVLDLTYNPTQPSNVIVLGNVEESDEMMLNEDSVCEMLGKVIQEHDHQTSGLPSESPLPKPVRASNAVELHNDETSEEDEGEKTVDYYADRTLNQGEEKVRSAPYVKQQQASGSVKDIPVNSSPKDKQIRRDRLFSFLSQTLTSETDTEPKSVGVVDLDELYNDEMSEEKDQIQEESMEGELTVDFYNDQTVLYQISPFEPVDEEAKARRKRMSLAPCLKTLTLESPSCDQSAGSPITEDDEDEDGAEEQAVFANSNESHRMKMAASFHQRVVVGEDKPANNNTPRDHHRTPRDSSTSEDRLRVYQEKSREGLIGLLEDRDNEISDLKDYIDSLLLKVIDTCPTVLQTPVKAKTSRK